jgi:hypothetical protein
MNSTAATMYQPVTFFANPDGFRNPSIEFAVAIAHLHKSVVFDLPPRTVVGGVRFILGQNRAHSTLDFTVPRIFIFCAVSRPDLVPCRPSVALFYCRSSSE